MKLILPSKKIKGYTLVEILVVLFIISIVTSVALLSIGRSENKKMQMYANELSQLLTLAEEQAMLQPGVLGVSFTQHAFQFNHLEKNKWEPLQDTILNKHVIPDDIQVSLKGGIPVEAGTPSKKPQIVISTNGDVTPFTIYIGKKDEKPLYAVIGSADGQIISQSLS